MCLCPTREAGEVRGECPLRVLCLMGLHRETHVCLWELWSRRPRASAVLYGLVRFQATRDRAHTSISLLGMVFQVMEKCRVI